jgi:hypothetical protein
MAEEWPDSRFSCSRIFNPGASLPLTHPPSAGALSRQGRGQASGDLFVLSPEGGRLSFTVKVHGPGEGGRVATG